MIPKKFVFYWHSKHDICNYFNDNIQNLKIKYSDFTFDIFDETEAKDFIYKHFGELHSDTFESLIPQAFKCDFFRYCYIFVNGGIYLDMKYEISENFDLNKLLDRNHFVWDINRLFIYNALIISEPNNNSLLKAINLIIENVKNDYYGDWDLSPTGPELLQRVLSDEEKKLICLYHETGKINYFEGSLDEYNKSKKDQTVFYFDYKKRLTAKLQTHIPYLQFWLNKKIYDRTNPVIKKTFEFIKDKLMPTILSTNELLEGNIFFSHHTLTLENNFNEKRKNIVRVCQNNNIQNCLEIGFNSGFSALLMLMSNPNLKLTCVDINYHKYTLPCFNILKSYFGSRINLIFGNSNEIVPQLIGQTYDLIHIDGAHDPQTAEKDIQNCLKLTKSGSILIMDDTNDQNLLSIWNKYVHCYNMKNLQNIETTYWHDIKVFP